MKNKIIFIGDKFYKQHDVVLLPTKERSNIGINKNTGKIYYFDPVVAHEAHYLYILSNEEIKEGDWFIDFSDNEKGNIHLCRSKPAPSLNNGDCKKIIATTDKSLNGDFQICKDGKIGFMEGYTGIARLSNSLKVQKQTFTRDEIKELNDDWVNEPSIILRNGGFENWFDQKY